LIPLSFDEATENTDHGTLIFLEIEAVLFAEAQLQKVVVESFSGQVDLLRGVVEGVAHNGAAVDDPCPQFAPDVHFLDHFRDS